MKTTFMKSCIRGVFLVLLMLIPASAFAVVQLIYEPQLIIGLPDGFQGRPVRDPNQRDSNGDMVIVGVVGADGLLHDVNPPHAIMNSYNNTNIELIDFNEVEYVVTESGQVIIKPSTPTPTPSETPTLPTATAGSATDGGGGGGQATNGGGGGGQATNGGGGGGGQATNGGGSPQDQSDPPPQQLPDPQAASEGETDPSANWLAQLISWLLGGGCTGDRCSVAYITMLSGWDPNADPAVHYAGINLGSLHEFYVDEQAGGDEPPGLLAAIGCDKPFAPCGSSSGGSGGAPKIDEIFKAEIPSALLKGEVNITDVGIDKEILKMDKAVYQPIDRMQKDHLGDTNARDDYLENALTVKGVAIMTMGFLDKTVGSGLTAIQQQADMNVTQHILKQISWTTTHMADPDGAQTYIDNHEKLEACLTVTNEEGKKEKTAKKNVSRKIVEFTCSDQCGKSPEEGDSDRPYRRKSAQDGKTGNGTYAYCVCCAEAENKLNKITKDGKNQIKAGAVGVNEWSLVERSTVGTKKAEQGKGGGGGKAKDAVEKYMWRFKQFYGDYVMQGVKEGGGDAPYQRLVFMPPQFSAQRVVRAYFNGCNVPPTNKQKNDWKFWEPGKSCKTKQNFGFAEKHSICPSFVHLLKNAKDILAGKIANHKDYVVGASQGMPVDARMIQNVLRLNGARLTQLKNDPEGIMKRAIFNWCIASASAAADRHHATFIPLARAFITSGNQVTSMDKDKLMLLLNRRTEDLGAEKRAAMAAFIAHQASAVYSHRADIQAMAEAAASTAAGMRDMGNLGYASTVTDNQEFYDNGGSPGGG